MSDYMFMLESHLSPEQNRAIALVEKAGIDAGCRVYISGGPMRDMLGGFPVRQLEFTVEGDVAKLVRTLGKVTGVEVLAKDSGRGTEIQVGADVKARICAARVARYGKPGTKPQYEAASIHEDLRGRDFTINSIALSIAPGSRGLLLDPMNGISDLETRELRVNSSTAMYDEPVRVFRMHRYRMRMGLELHPRTESQYANVREAKLEKKIPVRQLLDELTAIADEPSPAAVVEALDREKLLELFSPAFTGSKLNIQGLEKLERVRQMVPFGAEFPMSNLGLFLHVLTEKFTADDNKRLISDLKMSDEEVALWTKLESRAKKLEKTLASPKLNRASAVYKTLRAAPGEEILFLEMYSKQRLVTDRIKNHLTRYLLSALEVSDRELAHLGLEPQSAEFRKAKNDYILAKLDGRIRKPAEEALTADAV